jgi:hypothetical protein
MNRSADRVSRRRWTSISRNLALVINGAPQIHPAAGDAHHHHIQMPAIARRGPTLAQPSRNRGTELQHSSPHRFVGDVQRSFGQQFLDIAVAQGEAEAQPDRVLHDLGGGILAEPCRHSIRYSAAPDTVSVAMSNVPSLNLALQRRYPPQSSDVRTSARLRLSNQDL